MDSPQFCIAVNFSGAQRKDFPKKSYIVLDKYNFFSLGANYKKLPKNNGIIGKEIFLFIARSDKRSVA